MKERGLYHTRGNEVNTTILEKLNRTGSQFISLYTIFICGSVSLGELVLKFKTKNNVKREGYGGIILSLETQKIVQKSHTYTNF